MLTLAHLFVVLAQAGGGALAAVDLALLVRAQQPPARPCLEALAAVVADQPVLADVLAPAFGAPSPRPLVLAHARTAALSARVPPPVVLADACPTAGLAQVLANSAVRAAPHDSELVPVPHTLAVCSLRHRNPLHPHLL